MDPERRRRIGGADAEHALKSRRISRLLVALPVGFLALAMALVAILRVASVNLGAAVAILTLAVGTVVWAIAQIVSFVKRVGR